MNRFPCLLLLCVFGLGVHLRVSRLSPGSVVELGKTKHLGVEPEPGLAVCTAKHLHPHTISLALHPFPHAKRFLSFCLQCCSRCISCSVLRMTPVGHNVLGNSSQRPEQSLISISLGQQMCLFDFLVFRPCLAVLRASSWLCTQEGA